MRAHQIMTRRVITVTPETTIVEAANTMLQRHVSGLPVVSTTGKLVGIISEGDFIRRSEIGTERKRGRFLKFILGSGKAATDFVHERGGKVGEIIDVRTADHHRGYRSRADRAADGKEQHQAVAGDARRPGCRHRVTCQPAPGCGKPCPPDPRSHRRR